MDREEPVFFAELSCVVGEKENVKLFLRGLAAWLSHQNRKDETCLTRDVRARGTLTTRSSVRRRK